MGALASAFQGLASKGPLGKVNRAVGTVGSKIGLPGMSNQGVPGFKPKPGVPQAAQQMGTVAGQLPQPPVAAGGPVPAAAPGVVAKPGVAPAVPPGAGAPTLSPVMRTPLTPRIAMSGAQAVPGQFPAPQPDVSTPTA